MKLTPAREAHRLALLKDREYRQQYEGRLQEAFGTINQAVQAACNSGLMQATVAIEVVGLDKAAIPWFLHTVRENSQERGYSARVEGCALYLGWQKAS